MFQIATFDSWVSGETRPVCFEYPQTWFTFFFFLIYAFMAATIMLNVAVAVLLDRFIEVANNAEQDMKSQKEMTQRHAVILKSVLSLQGQFKVWRLRSTIHHRIMKKQQNEAIL